MMSEAMVCNYIDKKRADVERIVRLTMAVGDVQKREGIVVDEAELAKEVANSKAEFDRMGQEYDESRVTEQAREVLEGAMVSGVRREREREREWSCQR
jgi:trigger factor